MTRRTVLVVLAAAVVGCLLTAVLWPSVQDVRNAATAAQTVSSAGVAPGSFAGLPLRVQQVATGSAARVVARWQVPR